MTCGGTSGSPRRTLSPFIIPSTSRPSAARPKPPTRTSRPRLTSCTSAGSPRKSVMTFCSRPGTLPGCTPPRPPHPSPRGPGSPGHGQRRCGADHHRRLPGQPLPLDRPRRAAGPLLRPRRPAQRPDRGAGLRHPRGEHGLPLRAPRSADRRDFPLSRPLRRCGRSGRGDLGRHRRAAAQAGPGTGTFRRDTVLGAYEGLPTRWRALA